VKPVRDLMPEYLLGGLPAEQGKEIESLLAVSPFLRREADELTESLATAAAGALTPRSPPPSVRARLLATVGGVDRFAPFLDDLSGLFELPADAIRGLLARIDGPGPTWESALLGTELEGAELFHFQVGPGLRAAGAAGGVLRVGAGVRFPRHRHHGTEITYVLEGGYCVDGRVHGPGSAVEMRAGTVHDYRAARERDLVVMVLHRGITIVRD
jgi:quercetin dioxygenase-like cupin family protein